MTLYSFFTTEIFGQSLECYLLNLLIFIPTFYFFKWLLKKYIKVDKIRIITTWLGALVLTPFIYLGLIILTLYWIFYTPSENFNKKQWLTDIGNRYQMADDIIDSKMLMNKDTNQLKQILGVPEGRNETAKTWSYYMGCSTAVGLTFHNLDLSLDTNGILTSIKHIETRE